MMNDLEEAAQSGQKRSKGQGKAKAAQDRVFRKYLGEEPHTKQQFADPALFFSN